MISQYPVYPVLFINLIRTCLNRRIHKDRIPSRQNLIFFGGEEWSPFGQEWPLQGYGIVGWGAGELVAWALSSTLWSLNLRSMAEFSVRCAHIAAHGRSPHWLRLATVYHQLQPYQPVVQWALSACHALNPELLQPRHVLPLYGVQPIYRLSHGPGQLSDFTRKHISLQRQIPVSIENSDT